MEDKCKNSKVKHMAQWFFSNCNCSVGSSYNYNVILRWFQRRCKWMALLLISMENTGVTFKGRVRSSAVCMSSWGLWFRASWICGPGAQDWGVNCRAWSQSCTHVGRNWMHRNSSRYLEQENKVRSKSKAGTQDNWNMEEYKKEKKKDTTEWILKTLFL